MKFPTAIRRCAPIIALVALNLVRSSAVEGQETGRLSGHVVTSGTHWPLARANVEILGTDISVRTDGGGRFEIKEAPAGSVLLRTSLDGYVTATDRVAIPIGGTVRVEVRLEEVAYLLDEILVQARTSPASDSTRRPQPRRSGETALDALVGKVPGLTVLRADQVGGNTQVMIRGIRSLSLPGDPAIYVDGVRVSSMSYPMGRNLASGILDLVPVETIDSIRVLHGASVAAQYGFDTSNGVILIFTERGGGGR
jgi:TonB-dependent SusC/RagA subfamily outer membrane receptor